MSYESYEIPGLVAIFYGIVLQRIITIVSLIFYVITTH